MEESWQGRCCATSGFVGVWRWPVEEEWRKASARWQGIIDATAIITAAVAVFLVRLQDFAMGGVAIGFEGRVELLKERSRVMTRQDDD